MKIVLQLGLIVMLIASSLTSAVRAEMIRGYPDVIICTTPNAKFVLKLQKVLTDGSATYGAEQGSGVAVVGTDKILRREGRNDCNGKSLDQLKQNGQTRDLTK